MPTFAATSLPISYCTNVHPGQTVAEVEQGLDQYTVPISKSLNEPFAAGLWLAQTVVAELLGQADGLARFKQGLLDRQLTCYTLNAFPFGDFHAQRVKEQVGLPDWSNPLRFQYTLQCAEILATLLPDNTEGSISTLPLGFQAFQHAADFKDQCCQRLVEFAIELDRLRQRTGRLIRLAIEPEPFGVVETTPQAIELFQQFFSLAATQGVEPIARTYLGLCYDACHQAVEYEDLTESIQSLDAVGIRINKFHISCAIELKDPITNLAGRKSLQQYIEPRYLHQVFAKTPGGQIAKSIDLSEELVKNPPADFAAAESWRVHFHVPVNVENFGPLATTRPALEQGFRSIAALDYVPHLELETYTWQVLPNAPAADLVSGLTSELQTANQLWQQAIAKR